MPKLEMPLETLSQVTWTRLIWVVVAVYSFLPLLVDPTSQPPGIDPTNLHSINWTYSYYGFIPIKVIGIPLYYYSTFLAMYLGLWFFFRGVHKYAALLAWVVLLFLSPVIYLNMVSGTWITIHAMFLFGLPVAKLYSDYIRTGKHHYAIWGMTLGFFAPMFHGEGGSYVTAGLCIFTILSLRWRLLPYLILPILGVLISAFILHSRGYEMAKSLFTDTPNVDTVVEVMVPSTTGNLEPTLVRLAVDTNTIDRIETGEVIELTLPSTTNNLTEILELTDSNTREIDITVRYWWENFVTSNLHTLIYITVILSLVAIYQNIRFKVPHQVLIILAAVPIMALASFTPLELNGFRIGLQMTTVLLIALVVGILHVLHSYPQLHIRVLYVSLGLFFFAANLINSIGIWYQVRT